MMRQRAWQPLAKLPVFWALEGKRAIVAGGSDAAAWKAELLGRLRRGGAMSMRESCPKPSKR